MTYDAASEAKKTTTFAISAVAAKRPSGIRASACLVNTVAGVKGVEPTLVRAARCLGASEVQVLWRIVLRAALPSIVTGVRVGWMALVAAELVGASSGLGFLINDARTVLRTDYVIVGMATIGLVGLLIDRVIRAMVHRLLPWSQAFGK